MNLRRILKLGVSAAIAAAALGAAVAGADELVSWRFEAEAAGLQRSYHAAELAIEAEHALLAAALGSARTSSADRATYVSTASVVTGALAEVADRVPADARPRLGRIASMHRGATRAALRAFAASAGPTRQRRLRQANQLLKQVAGSVDALGTSTVRTAAPARSYLPGDYLALAAVALAALVGIVTMLRRAIATVTNSTRPSREDENLDLARLVSEARTDSLTRLANHRAFHDQLAIEIDRRNSTGTIFSLMAIDLDGLKAVNDTHGHQAGDAHIVRLALALQVEVGEMGTVYRTGGDEFMVLLPNSRNWHAINLAHRIHAATLSATGARALSIGVAETKGTEHRHDLVRQADLALYEAKRAKLAVVTYQSGLERAEGEASERGLSAHLKALASALARTVDARDHGTSNHSEMVAELAAAIAVRHGIKGDRLERLRVAALLHDVGKISVPDAILLKPMALGKGEQELMREHVAVGRDILVAAGFVEEATWVLHHHEHYDGTGYPQSLNGEDIPLESRIIAVADAYEAMTGERPYRETLTSEQALAELSALGDTQFDASCVRAVTEIVGAAAPAAPPAWPPTGLKARSPEQPRRSPAPAPAISQLQFVTSVA